MSTVNLQNVTHMGDRPMHFVIAYNSQNVVLCPRGHGTLYVKRLRVPRGQEKLDLEGLPRKDAHGNIHMIDALKPVLVERNPRARPASPAYFWAACPLELYEALRGGQWEHVYTTGELVPEALCRKQSWYAGGQVWFMEPVRPDVPRQLARIEDLVALLETAAHSPPAPPPAPPPASAPPADPALGGVTIPQA